jgi:uncharacterized repeat protein (TIGR03943 family)
MRRSVQGACEVVALALVAAFLTYGAATGRVRLFVAPAYIWLPPAAAVLLAAMALARLRQVLQRGTDCDCAAHAAGPMRWLLAAALAAPVALGAAVDPQQFSPKGVRKRRIAAAPRDVELERAVAWALGRAAAETPPPAAVALPAEPTVLDLYRAAEQGSAAALAGRFVTVVGQCDPLPDDDGRRFALYRLVVTCCIADALTVTLDAIAPEGAKIEPRQWVRVEGLLHVERPEAGGALLIRAAAVTPIPTPAAPYL